MPVLDQITEKMPGGFFVYQADADEEILYANAATIKIYGCTDCDDFLRYVQGSFKGMVHPADLERVQKSIDEQINTNNERTDQVQYRIRRKDGSLRWIEDFGHFVRSGDESLYYVFIYDITEKKIVEEEAKLAEQALYCEKKINQSKNAFIFNLSHDIRTPMNAILGYTELVRKHLDDPKVALTHLDRVNTAGRHLLALIDDLLELSELDAGGVHPKNDVHTLAKVVEDAVDLLRSKFEDKKIELAFEFEAGQVDVFIDAPRFQRAVTHILSNAVKFTPPHGLVTLRIKQQKSVSESGYGRFDLEIEDNGEGMSEDFVKRAFEAFEREQTSTQSGHVGTGIGLTVTRRIMDILGGSISLKSTKGVGSCFTLSLPLKLSGAVPTSTLQEETPKDTQARGRILLVEDIELNRALAETVLTECGYEVDSVPDGCDAVEAVQCHPEYYYDAVLMDIQMPIMNGYEATRAIRALDREDVETLPIIALSANARDEDKAMSLESGMDAHVAKPFDIEGLVGVIKMCQNAAMARKKNL